jgi:hypothetical protein
MRYSSGMTRKRKYGFLFVLVCLSCSSLFSQDDAARSRLFAAHAQYYTPTASGLKSFHCDASIDWKAMLSRFSGTDVPDDNPFLTYLYTIHLAVSDDLRGKGSLDWTTTVAPPAGKEEPARQIREGLQTSVAGFFQSWNAYMNGSMVPLPDSTITIKTVETGFHLSGMSGDLKLDEDFDKNMLLTQVKVVGADLKVLATPSYVTTPDGLVVSAVTSQVNQPPTAPLTEVTFHIEYAKVDSFQIPSHVIFDVKNTGVIAIDFSACKASVGDFTKNQ